MPLPSMVAIDGQLFLFRLEQRLIWLRSALSSPALLTMNRNTDFVVNLLQIQELSLQAPTILMPDPVQRHRCNGTLLISELQITPYGNGGQRLLGRETGQTSPP